MGLHLFAAFTSLAASNIGRHSWQYFTLGVILHHVMLSLLHYCLSINTLRLSCIITAYYFVLTTAEMYTNVQCRYYADVYIFEADYAGGRLFGNTYLKNL